MATLRYKYGTLRADLTDIAFIIRKQRGEREIVL